MTKLNHSKNKDYNRFSYEQSRPDHGYGHGYYQPEQTKQLNIHIFQNHRGYGLYTESINLPYPEHRKLGTKQEVTKHLDNLMQALRAKDIPFSTHNLKLLAA